jgi:hypothetical protein
MNDKEQSLEWKKCLEMALYYKPEGIEEQTKIATNLYEVFVYDSDQMTEYLSYWVKCLEMALCEKPRNIEEQIKIASSIYKYAKELNNNKSFLQKALDKIKTITGNSNDS